MNNTNTYQTSCQNNTLNINPNTFVPDSTHNVNEVTPSNTRVTAFNQQRSTENFNTPAERRRRHTKNQKQELEKVSIDTVIRDLTKSMQTCLLSVHFTDPSMNHFWCPICRETFGKNNRNHTANKHGNLNTQVKEHWIRIL